MRSQNGFAEFREFKCLPLGGSSACFERPRGSLRVDAVKRGQSCLHNNYTEPSFGGTRPMPSLLGVAALSAWPPKISVAKLRRGSTEPRSFASRLLQLRHLHFYPLRLRIVHRPLPPTLPSTPNRHGLRPSLAPFFSDLETHLLAPISPIRINNPHHPLQRRDDRVVFWRMG